MLYKQDTKWLSRGLYYSLITYNKKLRNITKEELKEATKRAFKNLKESKNINDISFELKKYVDVLNKNKSNILTKKEFLLLVDSLFNPFSFNYFIEEASMGNSSISNIEKKQVLFLFKFYENFIRSNSNLIYLIYLTSVLLYLFNQQTTNKIKNISCINENLEKGDPIVSSYQTHCLIKSIIQTTDNETRFRLDIPLYFYNKKEKIMYGNNISLSPSFKIDIICNPHERNLTLCVETIRLNLNDEIIEVDNLLKLFSDKKFVEFYKIRIKKMLEKNLVVFFNAFK